MNEPGSTEKNGTPWRGETAEESDAALAKRSDELEELLAVLGGDVAN